MNAFLGGDRAAFELLYRRHRDRVFRVCRGMLGNDERAADVAQDVFIRLIRRLDRFDGRAAFTTWLHRVTMNACYDVLRARRATPVAEIGEVAEKAAEPDPPAEADLAMRLDIRSALGRLPHDQREAVVLHDVAGFRYDDVAAIAGVPVGTVKSRLARGRIRLAELLVPGNSPAGSERPTGDKDEGRG